jgi:7-cyano-7-deazaguanine synthase in queuosine biosynthesis
LDIDDIQGRIGRDVPPPLHDLVEIATYVYAADQATGRGGKDVDTFGGSWRRAFEFHVPVRVPDLWNDAEVKRTLCAALGFLSDDHYEFTFYPAKDAPDFQMYLKLPWSGAAPGRPERVMMFSGGLDSLAGAVEEVLTEKRRVVMVNHRPTEKHNGRHRELEKLLAARAGGVAPDHIAVRVNKDKVLGREHTQRTRSFLFVALGATVARMLGLGSVRFYENGVVSLNLPICEQLVGSRATRTTHPRVLRGFQSLLSLVAGESVTVDNPFRWETKGEIIQRILRAGCGPMITPSVSCAHTWQASLEFPHCGVCSQCLDRRFGILAAGAEEFDVGANYKVDVFTGSRPKDVDKILGAAYLERANEILRIKDVGAFLMRYPEVAGALRYLDRDAASGAAMVLDLYRRHATEVSRVGAEMVRRCAPEIFARTLPEDCLVRCIFDSGAVVVLPAGAGDGGKAADGAGAAVPAEAAGVAPRYVLRKGMKPWKVVFDGAEDVLDDEKGLHYVAYLLKNPNAIHGVDLAAKISGRSIIQEANLSGDGDAAMREIRREALELMGVLRSEHESDEAKEKARGRLEELAEVRKAVGKGPASGAEKAVRAVRRAIDRLRTKLLAAKARDGGPHPVFRPFGEHVEKHIWIPSSRYSGGRRARTLAGVAGFFTYEAPDGVSWEF